MQQKACSTTYCQTFRHRFESKLKQYMGLILVLLCIWTFVLTWITFLPPRDPTVIRSLQRVCTRNRPFENAQGTDIYIYTEPAFSVGYKLWMFFRTIQLTGFRGLLGHGRFYCVFQDERGGLSSSRVNVITNPNTPLFWWSFRYQPALFECVVPGDVQPIRVSVSSTSQHPGTSFIPIMADNATQPTGNGVAICLQHLANVTSSHAVAEWMEMQRLQGADRVILYGYQNVSAGVERLLQHYIASGFLQLQPWRVPWPSSRDPADGGLVHTSGHQASIQDCLLRFRTRYEYLVFIDMDEYIMASSPSVPLQYQDLYQFMEIKMGRSLNVIHFKTTLFCTNETVIIRNDSDSTLYTQTFQKREPFSKDFTHLASKVIIRPHSVSTMGIHGPEWWLADDTRAVAPPDVAKLHHYKPKQGCGTTDSAMGRLKGLLPKMVKDALMKVTVGQAARS